jgi:hypothetical protein
VRAAFDWKPLLCEEEILVWQGQAPMLKIVAMAAVALAVSTLLWLIALQEVAQAPGGADCFSDNCPAADRKSGLVVWTMPGVMLLSAVATVILPFTRKSSAETSNRVMIIGEAPWLRQPNLEQIPVKGASATLDGFTLRVAGLDANKRLLLTASSRAELKRAKSMIQQVASDGTIMGGTTP